MCSSEPISSVLLMFKCPCNLSLVYNYDTQLESQPNGYVIVYVITLSVIKLSLMIRALSCGFKSYLRPTET